MTTQPVDLIMTEPLTATREAALHLFGEKLEQHRPGYHIRAGSPYHETIIQVWLENVPYAYRKGLEMCKLAVEVEEKTGITMMLR
jgi:hypothetical protein